MQQNTRMFPLALWLEREVLCVCKGKGNRVRGEGCGPEIAACHTRLKCRYQGRQQLYGTRGSIIQRLLATNETKYGRTILVVWSVPSELRIRCLNQTASPHRDKNIKINH